MNKQNSSSAISLIFFMNMVLLIPSSNIIANTTQTQNQTDQQYELVGTESHPFWSLNRGCWVNMSELLPGEQLLLADGRVAVVDEVDIRTVTENEVNTTYNFEVSESHTYFIGTNGVLVHNMCQLDESEERLLIYISTKDNPVEEVVLDARSKFANRRPMPLESASLDKSSSTLEIVAHNPVWGFGIYKPQNLAKKLVDNGFGSHISKIRLISCTTGRSFRGHPPYAQSLADAIYELTGLTPKILAPPHRIHIVRNVQPNLPKGSLAAKGCSVNLWKHKQSIGLSLPYSPEEMATIYFNYNPDVPLTDIDFVTFTRTMRAK